MTAASRSAARARDRHHGALGLSGLTGNPSTARRRQAGQARLAAIRNRRNNAVDSAGAQRKPEQHLMERTTSTRASGWLRLRLQRPPVTRTSSGEFARSALGRRSGAPRCRVRRRLSTAVLEPVARCGGLESVPGMLTHRRRSPAGLVRRAVAERLPFAPVLRHRDAAGSLNYVDLPVPSGSRRVLTSRRDGHLRLLGRPTVARRQPLDEWYGVFECVPPKPGYDMDVTALDYASHGLKLNAFEAFEIAVP